MSFCFLLNGIAGGLALEKSTEIDRDIRCLELFIYNQYDTPTEAWVAEIRLPSHQIGQVLHYGSRPLASSFVNAAA
jgi:hypothetical protein